MNVIPRMLLPLVLAAGCDEPDPCAGVDLGDSGLGLALTERTHEGWGQADCFACHVAARIHDAGCLPEGLIDLEGLRATELPCQDCHGDNGVAPTEDR